MNMSSLKKKKKLNRQANVTFKFSRKFNDTKDVSMLDFEEYSSNVFAYSLPMSFLGAAVGAHYREKPKDQ